MISTKIPTATEMIKSNKRMIKLSLLGLLVLKRTARATPLFISNPESIAPTESIPSAKSSLIMILEAQFGITPTKADRILASIGLFRMSSAILSSPTICINMLRKRVIVNMNPHTFKV